MRNLIRKYEWKLADSPEGEEGDAVTVYRDIYQGDIPVAERVLFEDAECLVLRHNRCLKELAQEFSRGPIALASSYRRSLDARGIDISSKQGKTDEREN